MVKMVLSRLVLITLAGVLACIPSDKILVESSSSVENTDIHKRSSSSSSSTSRSCREIALEDQTSSLFSLEEIQGSLRSCLWNQIKDQLQSKQDELDDIVALRNKDAELFENFTCNDDQLPTTQPIHNTTWSWQAQQHSQGQYQVTTDEQTYDIQILLDRHDSQIHLLENFVTPDECAFMEEETSDHMTKASTINPDGKAGYSENRRAQQGSVRIPYHKENNTLQLHHPLAPLFTRILNYTNHVTHLNLTEYGQENINSILYHGRQNSSSSNNEAAAPPDEYRPHCDGKCSGEPHKTGLRVATMILYCALPTRGGSTNFRQAGIHIQPRPHTAVFFSYINPRTLRMDQTRITEHSGCPVREGNKQIITQWLRYGVTADMPWQAYDGNGKRQEEGIVKAGLMLQSLTKEDLEKIAAMQKQKGQQQQTHDTSLRGT